MEILDALERKVTELMNEIAVLRKRNAELESKGAGTAAAGGESRKTAELENALEYERKLREAVLKRVSTLVRRLEEHKSAS